MKILSIDPATNTGFAFNNSEDGKKIVSGTWNCGSSKKDESSDMRLVRFEAELNNIYKKNKGIDLVVFEAARNCAIKSQRALVVQSEIQGVLKKWCIDNKIQYSGYSPSEIKKFATGKGNCSKDLVIIAAKEKFGINVKTSDEADAVCLLYLAIERYCNSTYFGENIGDTEA